MPAPTIATSTVSSPANAGYPRAAPSSQRLTRSARLRLAVGVEGVEDRFRGAPLFLVVGVMDRADAFQERLDAARLGRDALVGGVGAADHLGHVGHGGVLQQVVAMDERVKAALRAVMPKLDAGH